MEIGKTLDVYRVVAPLGTGGMGEVYRARDTELQRDVALKVLPRQLADDVQAMSRFRREAQLLAAVKHPNIATIHGFKEVDGIHFLVLELVEGESLAAVLKAGPLPVTEALRIGGQIAWALEAAHKRGVIHRDLKPANVMVSTEGWVKVLDFGLAKDLGGGRGALEATAGEADSLLATASVAGTVAGALMGTVPYMSPEQVRSEDADQRSDIWAFGCVLFESLTGHRAFAAPTTIETLSAILERQPSWEKLPADLPPALHRLLRHCLHKDRGDRLGTIAEARAELQEESHASPSESGSFAQVPLTPGPAAASAASKSAGPATLGYLDKVGRYTVVERIAAGGHGELYRAWDREQEDAVALKVLRPELVANEKAREVLRREATALSRLQHPNIATLRDFGTASGVDFVVTEYIHGRSLAARLAEGALPEDDVARLGGQIARALAGAHGKGILHRDLKASNILVTPEGRVKLIDFGLARPAMAATGPQPQSPGSGESSLTPQGPLLYQAPELLLGGEGDERSDIYSLGVVLYRMATAQWPFSGTDTQELRDAILNRSPKLPSASPSPLSQDLERVILKCLAREPRDRFASAGDVAAELEALTGTPETPAPEAATVHQRSARRQLPATLAAALAVAAGAVLLWFWLGRGEGADVRPASPAAAVDSLVVMPSRLLDPEISSYLSGAIPNTISAHLSRVEGLEVKLPPSSFDLEKFGNDMSRIAELYGAEAMVLSTVSHQQDDLVLNLQLVSAANRNLLWSEEYQGADGVYLDLARRGAEEIRQAVRPGSVTVGAAPISSDVELLVQQGYYYSRLYRNQGREEDKLRALELLQRVWELDPRQASAAAEIAVLHATSMDLGVSILEVGPEIRTWSERALEADPRSSRAWAAIASLEGTDSRRLELTLKAASYGPQDGYAQSRLVPSLFEQSPTLGLAAAREASRVDPLVLTLPLYEAVCLTMLGRIEEALARVDFVLGFEPEMPLAWWNKTGLLSMAGRNDEALKDAEQRLLPMADRGMLNPAWVELHRDFAVFGLAASQGDAAATDAAARRLAALARGERAFSRWQGATSSIAMHLARYGRHQDALDVIVFRSRQGLTAPYDSLLFSPELKPIRDDPRFQEILGAKRVEFDQMVAVLEQARAKNELPAYLEQPLVDLLKRIRRTRQEK